MKFLDKLRKSSTANTLSSEQNEKLLNNNGLDYFSEQGTLNRMIILGQEQFLKNMHDRYDRQSTLDDIPDKNADIEIKINNEFINERALKKYGATRQDFLPEGTQWFPRMRGGGNFNATGSHGDEDADSLDSFSSDFSHDGFAGPFSWETRSLQEMEFPPTPVGERKLSPSPAKNGKNKKLKKMSSIDIDDNSHRNYETIEQLRSRLKQNYNDAKRQREKYLNLSRKKESVKSLNGFRSKTQQQPVFKNYKQKAEPEPKTNNVVTFRSQELVNYRPEDPNQTEDTLDRTTNHSSREIIPTIYLGPTSSSPSKSNLKKIRSYNIEASNKKQINFKTQNITTVNATEVKARTTPKTTTSLIEEINSNGKKNHSKVPEINHNDVESVLQNQNIEESSGRNHKNSTDKENYSNVMDMLTNW